MQLADAHRYLNQRLDTDVGKYYSSGTSLNLGAGQIYDNVRYPLLDPAADHFNTVEGKVYILSHECDVDQRNTRPFNDLALIVPILPFEVWYSAFSRSFADQPDLVKSFLGHVAKREVSRVFYFPASDERLPYGGLIYLNQITHTRVSMLTNASATRICSVTAYGLEKVDQMLLQHFLRPKADRLALIYR